MKSKITSLTRPSYFTLPLSNIILQFTHPHQPGSIQEMLRSPHASELALHQCERGRGLRCTLRTRRRLCGGGLPRRATLRCRWLRRRLRRRLRSAADAARAPCEEDPTWPDRRDGRRSRSWQRTHTYFVDITTKLLGATPLRRAGPAATHSMGPSCRPSPHTSTAPRRRSCPGTA